MALTAAHFESLPPGGPVPTALELHALALRAASWRSELRVMLMDALGFLLGIPKGGWITGQSRLFEHNDVRLVWLLRRLARKSAADAVARNIATAARFCPSDLMLTVVTAAREHASSLEAVSMERIDSWEEGGLDFLWREKDKLGLPKSITANWIPVAPFKNPETGNMVYPAEIPARDQVIVYAAQLNASFVNNFDSHLRAMTRDHPAIPATAWRGSRIARTVWRAYAFLAPGGGEFDSKKTVAQQAGQRFGSRTALSYLANTVAPSADAPANLLDRIITDPEMNRVEWVRIAKARAAEALFLERLWQTTRELIPM